MKINREKHSEFRSLATTKKTIEYEGRCLTLALAFLNNTPYGKCEPTHDPKNVPPIGGACRYLFHCMMASWEDILEYANHWYENPSVKPSQIKLEKAA